MAKTSARKHGKKKPQQSNGSAMKILLALAAFAVVIGLAGFAVTITHEKSEAKKASSKGTDGLLVSAEDLTVTDIATIEIEGYGTVTLALDAQTAPLTVANFKKLAKEGFYDGLTFHRIMDGFMMQGGDPLGNGTGGSQESIRGEFSANGIANNISHVRGAVSMARSSDPDSASSQFFIVQSDSTFLDGNYAGFGFVTDGMDIVDQICREADPTDDNGTISPADQPVITSLRVTEAA